MVSLFKNITPLSNEKTKGQAAYDQLLLMNNVVVADVFKVCDYKNEAVDRSNSSLIFLTTMLSPAEMTPSPS